MHTDAHTNPFTHHEGHSALNPNLIALACQHVRTMSRQRRTRVRRAAREEELRQPLADKAGGALDCHAHELPFPTAIHATRRTP
jgi:hypothetical protein